MICEGRRSRRDGRAERTTESVRLQSQEDLSSFLTLFAATTHPSIPYNAGATVSADLKYQQPDHSGEDGSLWQNHPVRRARVHSLSS